MVKLRLATKAGYAPLIDSSEDGTVVHLEIDPSDTISVVAGSMARISALQPAVTALANAVGCKVAPGVVGFEQDGEVVEDVNLYGHDNAQAYGHDKKTPSEPLQPTPPPKPQVIPDSIFKGRQGV